MLRKVRNSRSNTGEFARLTADNKYRSSPKRHSATHS